MGSNFRTPIRGKGLGFRVEGEFSRAVSSTARRENLRLDDHSLTTQKLADLLERDLRQRP